MMRFIGGSAVSIAMLAASVVPAAAQVRFGWGQSYGNGYGHHRRHRGVSAGDVIAGVAVIGVIAAIASAAGKSNNRSRDRNYNDGYRGIGNEDQAAEACALRAEQRYGNGARAVIDDVLRTRDGYDVRGSVETRRNWNDDRQFSCTVRYGQLEDVRFGGDYSTYRDN
jgi:hypothetical protein